MYQKLRLAILRVLFSMSNLHVQLSLGYHEIHCFVCACADALGPPQQVRATVVNQTNITVTWSRPDGTDTVDTYTVSP